MTTDTVEVTQADRLHRADAPVARSYVRLDLARNTRLSVTRNVNGHVHITVGQNEATLILHPHAAKRLIANIGALLEGEDFTHE